MEYDSRGLGEGQLAAYVDGGIDGQLVFEPSFGKVLKPGQHTLTARFVPTDTHNFESSSHSVNLQVEKIRPVLKWEPPKTAVLMADKTPPNDFFCATLVSRPKDSEDDSVALTNSLNNNVKGRFDYTYKYVLKEERESLLGEEEVFKYLGVQNSRNYKYDCVMTVVFQPEAKFSKLFAPASMTIIVPTIGEAVKVPDLYPRDRVISLFPYGDRSFADEYGNN